VVSEIPAVQRYGLINRLEGGRGGAREKERSDVNQGIDFNFFIIPAGAGKVLLLLLGSEAHPLLRPFPA
jgi:hypothetical protein